MISIFLISNPLSGMESPVGLFSPHKPEKAVEEHRLCTICQEDILLHEAERKFPCSHSIHNRCYRNTILHLAELHQDFNCPLCKFPVIISPHIPSKNELERLSAAVAMNNPAGIERATPDESIRMRCSIFAQFLKQKPITDPVLHMLEILFNDSMYACNIMPRLPTIIAQRNQLDEQLSNALEKLSMLENCNKEVAPYISQVAELKEQLQVSQKDTEVYEAKLTRKRTKLSQCRQELSQRRQLLEIFEPEYRQSIVTKCRLKIGLSACAGIMAGLGVRSFFANETGPATKSGIAAGTALALVGFGVAGNHFTDESKRLDDAVEESENEE